MCRSLKLEEKSVVACYVYGSRLWGTASDSSDWDFIIVKRSEKSGGGKKAADGKAPEKAGNTHVDNIDAAIYDEVCCCGVFLFGVKLC